MGKAPEALIGNHLEELRSLLPFDPAALSRLKEIALLLRKWWTHGLPVFVFGNGGSLSTAQHFALDLRKTLQGSRWKDRPSRGMLTYSPTDAAILTAIGNDLSFDKIFSDWMESEARSLQTICGIAFSFSGSGNVEMGLEMAWHGGFQPRILFTSGIGGEKAMSWDHPPEIIWSVPSANIFIVESIHSILAHAIVDLLMADWKTPDWRKKE